jgi:hypothetical protein
MYVQQVISGTDLFLLAGLDQTERPLKRGVIAGRINKRIARKRVGTRRLEMCPRRYTD